MSKMKFETYQKNSYVNIKPHENLKDEVLDYSVGLCEEVGEVMNHIKHRFWGNETLDRDKFVKEVGDVLWYLNALCTVLKFDVGIIAELNLKKLEYRFNGGYSIQKSKLRHESDVSFTDTEEYKNIMKKINLV